ncbi:MAG: hypothetical protein IJU84_04690, partial [Clostridia bacterium]|nr:hypothetical protein [Clostridia bacterium]
FCFEIFSEKSYFILFLVFFGSLILNFLKIVLQSLDNSTFFENNPLFFQFAVANFDLTKKHRCAIIQ